MTFLAEHILLIEGAALTFFANGEGGKNNRFPAQVENSFSNFFTLVMRKNI